MPRKPKPTKPMKPPMLAKPTENPRKTTANAQFNAQVDDIELVRLTLREVMQDEFAPPAAKAQAARTMAEINNLLGRNAKPEGAGGFSAGKPLDEMTLEELQRELSGSNPADDQTWEV